jgi:hypothetical protein
VLSEDWRIDHNIERLHSAHDRLGPVKFVKDWLNQRQLQLASSCTSITKVGSSARLCTQVNQSPEMVLVWHPGMAMRSPKDCHT